MKVTRQQTAEHRERILDAASRLFREEGVAGVGVAEITRAAGLTHGGFYRHFASKEALFAEASEAALRDYGDRLAEALTQPDGLRTFFAQYLDPRHVAERGTGCPVAGLAADVAREGPEIQLAFARGLRAFLAGGRDLEVGSEAWEETAAALATAVGALLMARAVATADPLLAEALLSAVREDPPA